MDFGSGRLSLGEPPLLYRNAFNIAAGQRPDRIIARDHSGDEILDFAGGLVIGPKPDTDVGLATDNEPVQRWISELDLRAHSPQLIGHRRPPRLQIVICIHDDTYHLPTGCFEFRSDCIAQTRVAFLVHDVERWLHSEALPIKMFDDVPVVLAFHQEYTLP